MSIFKTKKTHEIVDQNVIIENFMNNKLHSCTEPSYKSPCLEIWCFNGEKHRFGGPAVIESDRKGNVLTKRWFLLGKLHREDGPAVEFKSGAYQWYMAGKLHREDGPAVCVVTNNKKTYQWYLNGNKYDFENYIDKAGISDAKSMFMRMKYE